MDGRAAGFVSAADLMLYPKLFSLYKDTLFLRTDAHILAYVDIFIDEFLRLAQGRTHRHLRVHPTLFHDLDKMFRTFDMMDPTQIK